MYSHDDIKSVHLEVTSKCQARCPMCPRRIHGGPLLDGIYLKEIDLHTFKEWFKKDFISQLSHLSMCGNLGDPIIAKDTLEIFEYIRQLNTSIDLRMHTNGSGRTKNWWKKLALVDVEVIFGIDGLSDTHSLYRINTDWHKIIENAKTFINAGGRARWDMLVFKHNEHQIDSCKELSEQLGFNDFTVKHTTRFKSGKFDVIDDEYNLQNTLYPSKKSLGMIAQAKTAEQEELPAISCKAKNDNMIYVSANGNVSPCCWLDMDWIPQHSPFRLDYMIKINEIPNLNKYTMKEIFNSGYFDKIQDTWNTCGLKECGKQCGSFDKLRAQFEG